jgi:hypothetical protein
MRRTIVSCILRLIVSAAMTIPLAIMIVQYAENERGCDAIGGEWLAIGMLYAFLYIGTGLVTRRREQEI